jgi:hypothetical protein
MERQPIKTTDPVPPTHAPARWRPSVRTIRTMVLAALVVLMLLFLGVSALVRRVGNHAVTPSGPSSQAGAAAAACTDDGFVSSAAAPAYRSGTATPMALYARAARTAHAYDPVYVLGSVPSSSPAFSAYAQVQANLYHTHTQSRKPALVGCITRSHETKTDQTCEYSNGTTVPVYDATYSLKVYEARTGRVVLTKAVPSVPTFVCTSYGAYDGHGLYHAWDGGTVALALQPFAQ